MPLPPKTVELLAALVLRAGEVVDKDTLFREVWPDSFVVESNLTKNISLLRRTLDNGNTESVIRTVSKRGYCFVGVRALGAPAAPRERWRTPALLTTCCAALLLVSGNESRGQHAARPEAQREYLIGNHFWEKLERGEVTKALARFERARALDERSAEAHAGVAQSYTMLSVLGAGALADNLRSARAASERALLLNPRLSLPWASRAQVRVLADFDFAGAERDYRQALRLDPHSLFALYGYACLLVNAGRTDEARHMMTRAVQIDPASPWLSTQAARVEYYARGYDRTVRLLTEVLEREPNFAMAHYYMAMALGQQRRTKEARAHLALAKPHSSLRQSDEAWLDAIDGDRRQARRLLAGRLLLLSQGKAGPEMVILPAIDAGNRATAVWALGEMWKTKAIELLQLQANPRFDPIRREPEYAALVSRMW